MLLRHKEHLTEIEKHLSDVGLKADKIARHLLRIESPFCYDLEE